MSKKIKGDRSIAPPHHPTGFKEPRREFNRSTSNFLCLNYIHFDIAMLFALLTCSQTLEILHCKILKNQLFLPGGDHAVIPFFFIKSMDNHTTLLLEPDQPI